MQRREPTPEVLATLGPGARRKAGLPPLPPGATVKRARRPATRMTGPKRKRATKQEMMDRRQATLEIARELHPLTVRQAYYQTVVRFVHDAETGYRKVVADTIWLRRNGFMPYDWIADNTRWYRKPTSYNGVADALNSIEYRKNLWADAPVHVEVWVEKDALAGVLYPITSKYDVPLMVPRGFNSVTKNYETARQLMEIGKPVFIYYLGDLDPSGWWAGKVVEREIIQRHGVQNVTFTRLAVNEDQVYEWDLPRIPLKPKDTRLQAFLAEYAHLGGAIELDAIPPDVLRSIVRDALSVHIPDGKLKRLMVQQRKEAEHLARLIASLDL